MMYLLPLIFRFQLSPEKDDSVRRFSCQVESAMRVAYQTLHRADHQGGQRNLPEGLFVLLEIKRSAGMMTGPAISSLITSGKFLPSSFFLLISYFLLCSCPQSDTFG
jgi:hypothetical protein